jgi:diguanylate cyclase (GGDEF)-like protein
MKFDIETIWFVGALVAFGIASLLLTVRKEYPDYLSRVLMFCGLANICIGTALTIDFLHLGTGEFLFHIVAPVLVSCCLCLIYRAVAELKRQAAGKGWLLGPPAMMCVFCVWFTYIERNMTAEMILFNFLNMLVMFRIAWKLFKQEDGRRLSMDVVAACLYIVHASLTALILAGHILRGHFSVEFDYTNPLSILNSIVAILADGMIFMLFTLMVSERLNRVLTVQAMRDQLTNLYNRRAFEEIAFRELAGAVRTELSLSLLLIDIDHFKRINDKYGHLAGDAVLVAVTETLFRCLRDEDFLCRWGGDEFCALLPRARQEQAQYVAERILKALQDCTFSYNGKSIGVTVSIGVVSEAGQAMDVATLVNFADKALYHAKESGRNRYSAVPEVHSHPAVVQKTATEVLTTE